jgi:UDP-3-O-[3-hydroxymyristoyl] glucosamine N-acyltransferase
MKPDPIGTGLSDVPTCMVAVGRTGFGRVGVAVAVGVRVGRGVRVGPGVEVGRRVLVGAMVGCFVAEVGVGQPVKLGAGWYPTTALVIVEAV